MARLSRDGVRFEMPKCDECKKRLAVRRDHDDKLWCKVCDPSGTHMLNRRLVELSELLVRAREVAANAKSDNKEATDIYLLLTGVETWPEEQKRRKRERRIAASRAAREKRKMRNAASALVALRAVH